MRIVGAWSGHDAAYCVLENGQPRVHNELERFIREKEPAGDSLQLLLDVESGCAGTTHLATCSPTSKLTHYARSCETLVRETQRHGGQVHVVGHHEAHAANALFSSNFDAALIVTLDGGGVEADGFVTAATAWTGAGVDLRPVCRLPLQQFNVGGLWTRCARYIFLLQSGWPLGSQVGTIMSMAAFGDPTRYVDDFHRMLTTDLQAASHKPPDQPPGALIPGRDPVHPYLERWAAIARDGETQQFDLAAGLQAATERVVRELLTRIYAQVDPRYCRHLCLAGGVSLNSVVVGKLQDWFPDVESVHVSPTPHDGGLPIGAAQHVWHRVLGHERIRWADHFPPCLGTPSTPQQVTAALSAHHRDVVWGPTHDATVIDILARGKIVSIFGGGSESGRRALGNRSIVADPRDPDMKRKINDKVKHRQWHRPFAPSVLREDVATHFTRDVDSPYMSHVAMFREASRLALPAVAHVDGTARLQTVSAADHPWWHGFLTAWKQKSGVGVLLNTSFNDHCPILRTPEDAIECYLRTEIDHIYFRDVGILVSRK